jgi:transmembrane sensor
MNIPQDGPQGTAANWAAHWVARMDSGAWTAEDEAALQGWLAQDPAREGLLLRTHAQWLSVDAALAPAKGASFDAKGALAGVALPLVRRRKALAGMAAAVVAGLAVKSSLRPGVAYKTRLGEIRRVPLPDGSAVMINSSTDLRVRMEKQSRQVVLDRGEAWFEVAKEANRPFVVVAGRVKAQAVGTAFSVRRREEGVEVMVTEGIVETWSDEDAAPRIRLTAGQRALMNETAAIHFEPTSPSSVDRALAWRNGRIDLNGMTLADAADEFNRYNERQIIIASPDIAAEQLDGLFSINDPDGFAMAVKSSLNASVNTDDPKFIRIER